MNTEYAKGATEKIKGNVKEAVGRATGHQELENEGSLDQTKGALHNAVGHAKDVGKEAVESVKNAPSRH
jgi:uncharacterized protein YjbJ (UPF0337 family)